MSVPDPPSWAVVGSVLDVVLGLPADERAAYLDRHVADPTLRREVEAYLAYESARDPVLDAPDGPLKACLAEALGGEGALRPGDRLGPYRIERLLGAGGAGAVYAATDVGADKAVALKVLPPIREDAAERLRREGRALARMEHPHVARFMAVGGGDDGPAYLVMELVDGEPLTAYADRHDLPVAERVRLIEQTCAAVQHAHERLVVHRDLKPSNVLVACVDGRPNVKVVDFGIGRLLDDLVAPGGDSAPDGASSVYLRLTPAYASPEQLRGEPGSVASDVYSLGVLAYEVLAGRRPPDDDGARRAAVPPPSAVAPPERARALRGDLDAVVLRAMAPDPARRYATASEFLADLVRHREHRPVAARAPTVSYRLRRYVWRHRVSLALGAAVVAALATAAAVATAQALAARAEARAASDVTDLLTSMFDAADPLREAPGGLDTVRVGVLVARSTRHLLDAPPSDPVVHARMLCTLARVHLSLHRMDMAGRLFSACAQRSDRVSGTPPWLAAALRDRVVYEQDQGDYVAAERLARAALGRIRDAHGPNHREVGLALSRLGMVQMMRTSLDSAEHSLREALRLYRASDGEQSLLAATGHNDLGKLFNEQGEHEAALPQIGRALVIRRERLGSAHIRTGMSLNDYGETLFYLARYPEAEATYRRALRVYQRALGPDHPETAIPLQNLAVVYGATGRDARAIQTLETVNAFRRRVLGENHPITLHDYSTLAWLYGKVGRLNDAFRLFEDGLGRARRTLGPDHKTTLSLAGNLAFILNQHGQSARAAAIFQDLLPRLERQMGPEHPMVVSTRAGVVDALVQTGQYAEAEREARTTLAMLEANAPQEHPDRLYVLIRLGRALWHQERYEEAQATLLLRLALAEQYLDEREDRYQAALRALVELYEAWGQPTQAARYRARIGTE